MADNIQATPRNYLGGLLTDAYKWMQSPERTQQMQGFAGLLGTTGLPQTIERMAYGEPLTNIGRANVPLLKPETADALMTVAPMVGPAARGAGRVAGNAVNEAMVYGRGPLASITPQPMFMVGDDAVNLPQKGSKLVDIPIDMIEHGESAMQGGKLTWANAKDKIKDYASRETPLPPIDVVSPSEGVGKWMVVDGSHRLEAAKLKGQKTVAAYVSPYDKEGLEMVSNGNQLRRSPKAAMESQQQIDEELARYGLLGR